MKKLFRNLVPVVLAIALCLSLVLVGCGDDPPETYTVTVVGGTLADGTSTGSFEAGASVTVKATVPDGKKFVNWTSGQTIKSTSAEYTFTVDYNVTLTANFEDEQQIPTGKNVYVIEAESMNLDDFAGVGYSGGGAGDGAIQGVHDANMKDVTKNSLNKKGSDGKAYNDGFFLGFFNGAGTHFEFTFESDEDATDCTLTLRLGSEHGDMMFNPSLLTIKVNGEELDYAPFTVVGGEAKDVYGEFKDYTLSTKISLRKNTQTGNNDLKDSQGNVVIARPVRTQNVIEIILRANNYWGSTNPTGGPGIDCIKIETSSKLSWVDYWLGGWPEDFEEFNGTVDIINREGYVEKHGA